MSPPTPYAVYCPVHGKVYLTQTQYTNQLMQPGIQWTCVVCGRTSTWDDDNYKNFDRREDEAL